LRSPRKSVRERYRVCVEICKKTVQEEEKRKKKPEYCTRRRRAGCHNHVLSRMKEQTYLPTTRHEALIEKMYLSRRNR
jgi:hypothetical protein